MGLGANSSWQKEVTKTEYKSIETIHSEEHRKEAVGRRRALSVALVLWQVV